MTTDQRWPGGPGGVDLPELDGDTRGVCGLAYDLETGEGRAVPTASAARDAMLAWSRFHGLDPMRIPAGTTIARDAAGRCIHYKRFAADDIATAPLEDVVGPDGALLTTAVVEQGEAPPLPFPPEVLALPILLRRTPTARR